MVTVATAVTVPRLVVAAPGSGHGKTSVATGLLGALRQRGLKVSPHKVGPDYIDPGYHALAAGRPGRNLDPWLVGEERIAAMFAHGASTPTVADIAVIEGVMGLFDGASERDDFASTAHVARLLRAPVVLVVDASGVSSSVAALLHGFATFDPTTRIGGVIFNQVGSDYHAHLLTAAAERAGVPVLGTIRRLDSLAVPSRHLGLIPAAERGSDAMAVVDALSAAVAASVDLDAVLRLARTAGPLSITDIQATETEAARTPVARSEATETNATETQDPSSERTVVSRSPVTIAVAGGPAFTFGYAEHPELLAAAGAEVAVFDPLRDERLPAGAAGLVIGGGFPEVHAAQLSANAALRSQVAALARAGAPVLAECAGLLYLARVARRPADVRGARHRRRDDRQADARLPRSCRRHGFRARPGRHPRARPRVPPHGHPPARRQDPDHRGERVAMAGQGRGRRGGFRPGRGARVLPAHPLERPARRRRSHRRGRPRAARVVSPRP